MSTPSIIAEIEAAKQAYVVKHGHYPTRLEVGPDLMKVIDHLFHEMVARGEIVCDFSMTQQMEICGMVVAPRSENRLAVNDGGLTVDDG